MPIKFKMANTAPNEEKDKRLHFNVTDSGRLAQLGEARQPDPLMDLAMETVQEPFQTGVGTAAPGRGGGRGSYVPKDFQGAKSWADYVIAAAKGQQDAYADMVAPDNSPVGVQRRETNRAFRTANAFLPLENQPAEAWDTYNKLYDEAVEEDQKLKEMGGRAARELPVTLPKSFVAGTLGAVRGLVNEAGYIAQGATKAQMDENAEMWRRMGREDYAQDMEAAKDAQGGFQNWANFGQNYISSAAEAAAGYGKTGQALSNVAQGAGGMVPSIVSNLVVPGSGLPVMFFQASGNATEEAKAAGASDEAAAAYGTAVGAVEVLTEKMFGGIPGLNIGALDDALEAAVKRGVGSEAAQRAILFLIDALGEGVEEFTSEFGDYFLDKWLVGSDDRTLSQVNKDAWYSFLIGTLTSIAMQSPVEVANLAKTQRGREQLAHLVADQVGQQLTGQQEAAVQQATEAAKADGLKQIADQMAAEETARAETAAAPAEQYQKRLDAGETLADAEIGKLYQANQDAIRDEAWDNGQTVREYSTEPANDRLMRLAQEVAQERVGAEQPMTQSKVLDTVLDENANMGETGKKYARELFRLTQGEDGNALDFYRAFDAVYQAARRGETAADVMSQYGDALTPQAAQAAFNAGVEDMAAAMPQTALQQAGERYTYTVEQNDGGRYAVTVRDAQNGSEYNGGVYDTQEEAQQAVNDFKTQMEGVTANVESSAENTDGGARVPGREGRGGVRRRAEAAAEWRATRQRAAEDIRNSVAAAEDGEEVSNREAGISGGTDEKSMRLVRKYENDEMRGIKAEAAKKGVNVVFFLGEIRAMKGGKKIAARGEYSADGKTFYICLDDPDFTARQIYDHEDFHARSHSDAELQQAAENIIKSHSAAELREMVNAYVNAYGWTDMTNEEIVQEILADAYAGIDIFMGRDVFEGATKFTQDVRGAVKAREGEQQTERGPPENAKQSQKLADGIDAEDRKAQPIEGQIGLFDEPEQPHKWTFTELDGEFMRQYQNILSRVKETGKWTGEELKKFYANNPEYDFVQRFYDGDKTAKTDLQKFLSGIDDLDTLSNMAWYTTEVHWTPKYRGAKTKVRNQYKARFNELRAAYNGGKEINLDHREYSVDETRKLFDSLNSNPALKKLADKVFAVAERFSDIDAPSGLKVYATNKILNEYNKGVAGTSAGGTVWLRRNYFSDAGYTDQQKASVILHEMIHACTMYALTPGYGAEVYAQDNIVDAVNEIKAIYRQAMQEKSLQGEYGLKSVYEFMAELSNERFRDKLAKVSLLDRVIDAIKKFFGIKSDTMLDGASAALDYLLDNVDDFSRRRYYEQQERAMQAKERREGEARFSQKITPQQDADYSAAVERGDMEAAQRMVDEAAKAAGYDTPKLYHGTRSFGFTEFDPAKSDDRISLFATDNKRTAETYSGETNRTRINDRNRIDVDSLSGEQLLEEAKKHLKRYQDYRLMSEKDKEDVRKDARHDIIMAKKDAQAFIDEHDGAFDPAKFGIVSRATTALTQLASASDEDAVQKAWDDWQEAVWDFKDIDDSLCVEFLEAIGSKQLYFAKNHLEDVMYSGDMYMTGDDYSYSYIYDNQLALELDASLHKGIYALYGKPGKQLVIDADGSNWNQIKAPEELNLYGPQRTRDIAAAARALGYDSILFKNLRDNGGETAYNGTSNVYIFFDANRMKSADPVTYDDDGNVIPLSERFNPENEDIRYSQKLTAEDELRRQNETLQKRVEYWKGQTKRTTVPTARAEDAVKAARQIVKDYDSTADAKEIGAALKDLTDYIMRGENITYAEVKDRAVTIARDLVENAKTLQEGDGETFREVRDALQKPLIISARDANDVTPDGWGDYRNSIRGKVNVSINGKGTPIDTAYQQLSERFPSLFPEEITHPADQLQHMVDVIDELTPVYENPFSYNMAEAIEYAANDIIDRVFGDDIRMNPPTFADKAAAKLAAEKARGAERVAEVREQKNQQIADLKARNAWATAQQIAQVKKQRDAQIAALKEHYAEARKTAIEKKADSAARTRLLKIVKRLQNKKLPAVNRALLNQYIGNLDTVAKSITGNTIMDLNRLRAWYDDQKANNPDFIPDAATEAKIARLSQTQISDLTPTQVAELTEVLLNVENEINTQRRLIESEDKRDTRQMVLESLYNVEETKGSKKTAADWLVTNTLSPERLVKRLTGYAETDPLLMRTRELADGQRKMFDYQRRAEARFSKWANDKKLMDRLRSKERVKITGYSHGRAVEVEITPDMRMALYLHSLNPENMKHIANGGVTIPDIEIYLNGDIGEAYSRGKTIKLSPSNVRSIAAGMSEEERAYAKAAHDYFNGMSKDEINATSEKLVGYSIAGVDDYFPIETDKNFTKSDIAELKRDGTIEGMGFLKERQHASNAIYLVPLTDVLNKSIQNHAKYVGMAIPVRNFSKVWGMNAHNDVAGEDNGLRQAIGQKWGERGIKAVERIISDVQNPSRSEDGKVLAKIRSNYAGAVLTLNASVALKQAASYPTAAAVLGWEPLIKAMGNVGAVNLDLINKYTPLQWYRSKGYSTQELGDIRSKGGVMDKVLSASIKTKNGREVPLLNWIQGIDLATTRKLWKASEYYVQQHNADLQRGSDAYYKAVADIYNRVIEETQPNYTTMQRPQILRSSNQLLQSLVMFKTQPFQNFNILYDAIGELRAAERAAKNGDSSRLTQAKKNAVNAVSSNLVSAVVFAAMTMAWAYARRKKDKYEDKEGNFNPWAQLGKDVLSSEFGMIPFGSDAYDLFASWVFGDKYFGMSNVTSSSISDALNATKKVFDTLTGSVGALLDGDEKTNADPETVAKELFDCSKDLSKIAGIPLENVVNLVTAVYTNVASAINGEYMTAYSVLRLTKSMESSSAKGSAYDILFKAYKQDSEQFDALYQQMVEDGFDEKAIKSAMESRMKKEQGVSSASDLDERFMPTGQKSAYNVIVDGMKETGLYQNMSNSEKSDCLEDAYSYSTQTADGREITDSWIAKAQAGAAKGIKPETFILAKNTVNDIESLKDKDGKSIDNSKGLQTMEAIYAIPGLTTDQRQYLFECFGVGKTIIGYNKALVSQKLAEMRKNSVAPASKKTEPDKTESAEPEQKPATDIVLTPGSSAISQASYDPATQTVSVTYKSSGKTYTYEGVTQSDWDAFKASNSKGSYVTAHWK